MAVGLSWTAVGRVVRERGARLAPRDRRRADLQLAQPLPRVAGDPILARSSPLEITYRYASAPLASPLTPKSTFRLTPLEHPDVLSA
jgi:hypothetical protein